MPKLILTFLFFNLCLCPTALGQTSLKTVNSVKVENGFISETSVLADDQGQIFLEFIEGDRVAKKLDGQVYDGEILPPIQIDAPAKAPRARMRELRSFELISDNSEELQLIDQFSALHAKDRLRQSFKAQAGSRSQGVQIITLFQTDSLVNQPALWHYDPNNAKTPWERLGGIMGEAPAGEVRVFSAYLYSTGIFTIWDENPQPDFQPSFPNDKIELAEPSPYPSVDTSEDTLLLENDTFTESLLNDLDALGIDDTSATPLVPAVDNQSLSKDLIPAIPNTNIPNTTPLPPSTPVPTVPASDNNTSTSSLINQYFLENSLALTTAERTSLGNPTADIVEAFESKQVLNSNNSMEQSVRDDLLAQAEIQILTAELAEIIIDSIDNQTALAKGLEASEEENLWVNVENPNAVKVLNKIEEIQTWQKNNSELYASLDLNNPSRLKMDLIPKLKTHYEAYFTLPVSGASALQTNSFQNFGVNEGDLPEAGGFSFPWFVLVFFFIIGFSFYSILKKPY